jgi:23S rRNA (cytidine1920-2'-O)/16S rRNA (cytidine1409-2'-O)-methyltransferase
MGLLNCRSKIKAARTMTFFVHCLGRIDFISARSIRNIITQLLKIHYNKIMEKVRLDVVMTEKGLAESRSLAQKLVMAGEVRVDGQVASKPSDKVPVNAVITVDKPPRFVSRGGEKLSAALLAFGLTDLTGKVCADVGASTGGFTDCLLQAGAARVYSIDVGYGDFHWKLRNDPRVVLMERTNARHLITLPEQIEFAAVDASFISLKVLLPVIKAWFGQGSGTVIPLIKPQFEAGRAEVSRGDGVIRDESLHRHVVTEVLQFAENEGFGVEGLIYSPLTGPKGNREFLAHLEFPAAEPGRLASLIDNVFNPNETVPENNAGIN